MLKKRSFQESREIQPFAEQIIDPKDYLCDSQTSMISVSDKTDSQMRIIISDVSINQSQNQNTELCQSYPTNGQMFKLSPFNRISEDSMPIFQNDSGISLKMNRENLDEIDPHHDMFLRSHDVSSR